MTRTSLGSRLNGGKPIGAGHADGDHADGSADVTRFGHVDRTVDASFFIDFVDAANASDDVKAIKRSMEKQLQLRDGGSVLDVGCGTGDDARHLAQQVSPGGRVVGLDNSNLMIVEARRRAAGLGLPVEFVQGDAQHLDFADATFDCCRTERLLMHIEEPQKVLSEMARVTRPGGRVVVFDFDWDCMFVDSPDRETTRSVVRVMSDGVRHGWIGRMLPRLFGEAGLTQIASLPCVARPDCAFLHRLLDGALAKAPAGKAIASERLAPWWAELEMAATEGRFHAGIFGFVVSGRKS